MTDVHESGLAPAMRAAFLADEARAALGQLRVSWAWLAESRLPGKPGPARHVHRRLSAAAEHAEADQVRRDRRAALLALSGGGRRDTGVNPGSRGTPTTPIGPHADAGRVGPIKIRSEIAGAARALALDLLHLTDRRVVDAALPDPAISRLDQPCPWCGGGGEALVPAGWVPWAWPAGGVTCALCGGHGRLCVICSQPGHCHCDLTDAVMRACLTVISASLSGLRDPDRIVAVHAAIGRIDAKARRCLDIDDAPDHRWLRAPCPACARRELYAEVSSPDPQEWSVLCRSPLCACDGPGCGCGRDVRWKGRRHRWPPREFAALADRLGVELSTILGVPA